jgi:hypothetical protein
MRRLRTLPLLMAAGLVSLTACEKSSTSPTLFDTAQVTADVAASAGDAIATEITTIAGNEGAAALPAADAGTGALGSRDLAINRTRTCYDGTDIATAAVVAGCSPLSSVLMIITHASVDGSRTFNSSVTGGSSVSFSGVVHRVLDDTLRRTFDTSQPPVETSRSHSGFATVNDTSSYQGPIVTRSHTEAAYDSVVAVTWNLPRSTYPWPVSGMIVRSDTVHATFTNGTQSVTRDLEKRIVVTFTGDQNVTLTIDNQTCNLDLATHRVTNCQ